MTDGTPKISETEKIQSDWVDAKLLGALGILCVLLLFVLTVLLEAWYDSESLAERQKFQAQPSQALAEMRQRQELQLTYRWIDKKRRIAAIPIAQAMKLVQHELTMPATAELMPRTEANAK